jgi:hypothetical protein
MTDPATGQRSFLQALRVPFDLKGVALGAAAWLVLVLVGREIGAGPLPRDPATILELLGGGFAAGPIAKTFALHLAVAATLGVACCRIAAVRIARDEGVPLGEAVAFSIGNAGATLGAVLFLAAAAGFFLLCNALAGWAGGIAGIGPFLLLALFPLVLLSTLILFLVLYGAVFGLPLVLASLAVERNGALDAVSRAFSYVYSRPVLFFFYGLTVAFLAGILFLAAGTMQGLLGWSFTLAHPDGSGSHREVAAALARASAAVTDLRMPDFQGGVFGPAAVEGAAVLAGWIAWIGLLGSRLLLMGWVVYYAFGGATAAYFALRRDVDGTEEEEIWTGEDGAEGFGAPEHPVPAPAPAAAPAPAEAADPGSPAP